MNHIKTFMLLSAMTALFVGVGYLIGGPTGMAIALAFALVGNLISYSNADKIVLSMYRAQEVTANHPDARVRTYASDVREMAQRAGLPMPKITIIESDQPNAFATGRDPDHAAVAATTGLLTMLDRREIRALQVARTQPVRQSVRDAAPVEPRSVEEAALRRGPEADEVRLDPELVVVRGARLLGGLGRESRELAPARACDERPQDGELGVGPRRGGLLRGLHADGARIGRKR